MSDNKLSLFTSFIWIKWCDEKNEDFLKWEENDKDNLFELLHNEAYYLNVLQLEK